MASSFPAALDALTNPTATDTMAAVPHDQQHANANDAIEAIEVKLGVDGSDDPSSIDGRVTQLEEEQDMETWSATNSTGTTLSGHRVVTIDPTTGSMLYADCTEATHGGLPLGIIVNAVEDGASDKAQMTGTVTLAGWGWTPGAELYLGEEGTLVEYDDLPDDAAFARRIAIAKDSDTIVVDIFPPIFFP